MKNYLKNVSVKGGIDIIIKFIFYGFFIIMVLLMMFSLASSYRKITETSETIHKIDTLIFKGDSLVLKNKFVESLIGMQSESSQTFLFTIFSIVLLTIGMFVLSNMQTKFDNLENEYNASLNKLKDEIKDEIRPKIIEEIQPIIIKEVIDRVRPSIENNNKLITIVCYSFEAFQNYLYYLTKNDFSKLKDTLHFFQLFIKDNNQFFRSLAKTVNIELFSSFYDIMFYIYENIKDKDELKTLKNDCEEINVFFQDIINLIKNKATPNFSNNKCCK